MEKSRIPLQTKDSALLHPPSNRDRHMMSESESQQSIKETHYHTHTNQVGITYIRGDKPMCRDNGLEIPTFI